MAVSERCNSIHYVQVDFSSLNHVNHRMIAVFWLCMEALFRINPTDRDPSVGRAEQFIKQCPINDSRLILC